MSSDQSRENRVLRLDRLKALLAEHDYTTAADLAAELGVSTRTLHRDLALLREMGVPIEGDRGMGGGLHLESGWSLGRVHLNELLQNGHDQVTAVYVGAGCCRSSEAGQSRSAVHPLE
ncbi:helix-turn-helix transcriptional regulator [Streptomyces sp. NPDC056534]|uniref:helix-turn-helix transcriptional regulator n=1 Tax=Streptomyces sp. NPDC056534 TaxID=3345857 RepID=UPI0036BE6C33